MDSKQLTDQRQLNSVKS